MAEFDAVVVGSGPNGLTAAAILSRAGKRVLIVEQAESIGGGTRTEELTEPGFLHDVCSAIHPLGIASPVFTDLKPEIEWVQPEIPASHPLDGGRPAAVLRSVEDTARSFGPDEDRYLRIVGPLVSRADEVAESFLGPMTLVPKNPGSFVRMASRGALPASTIIGGFETAEARAVMSGMAAHAIAPLSSPLTGGVALLFVTMAHAYGWPMVKGGSEELARALGDMVIEAGGAIETGKMVQSLDDIPETPLLLLDLMPEAAMDLLGAAAHARHRRRSTTRRTGPGVFKIDWALSEPIPWADEMSPRAGTVHVGGTYEEVREAEDQVHSGRIPSRPFVLLAQQSLFDSTRAPAGKHTAWAYCHVPSGSTLDMTETIETQVERFAPGFRDVILARSTLDTAQLELHNPNYVGGDIAGGGFGMKKVFQIGSKSPYEIGEGVYLCSASTPPGAGVHGMCGYHAAMAALDS